MLRNVDLFPIGIGPLRGYIRRADMSQRDSSTTWIGPQSGYVPTGFVHYVDWSAERICPNGIRPLRGLVRKADMSQRDSSTSWIGPQSGYIPTGFVHYVDLSRREYFPNKKASHFCKALLPSLDSNQGPHD